MTRPNFNAAAILKNSDCMPQVRQKKAGGKPHEKSNLWHRIQSAIKEQLGVDRFGIWFNKTELMHFGDSSLVVGVPNVLIKQFLERKYKDNVREIAEELTGAEYDVRFEVAPRLLQNSRKTERGNNPAADRTKKPARSSSTETSLLKQHKEDALPKASRSVKRHKFEELLITDANKLPFIAAQEIGCKKDPRFDFLLLMGQPGFGKTAFLEAVADGAYRNGVAEKIIHVMAETWCNDYYQSIQKRDTPRFRSYYRGCDFLLLDGIQFLQGKAGAQDELVFTTKTLLAKGARVALSCNFHPDELEDMKPEVLNFLKGAFWTELVMPGSEELAELTQKLAAVHNIKMSPEAVRFISESFSASFRELNASVATVATYAALQGKRSADLQTACESLSASRRTCSRLVTPEQICKKVAAETGTAVDNIRGKARTKNACTARNMAILLTNELTELSLTDTGRFFGGRSHSTIKHSLSKALEFKESRPGFEAAYGKVLKQLR